MSSSPAQTLALAQHRFNAGQLQEAAQLFKDVLVVDPENGDALEGLAYVHARRGEHALAADHVMRASRRISLPLPRLHMAGQICQTAQRHEDALGFFRACLARDPNHVAALFGMAISLHKTGERDSALQALARLRRLQPRSAEVHYNCGIVMGEMDRFDDEVACYLAALALEPNFARAHVNLGSACCELHRFDDALKHFKKALAIDPKLTGARYVRAQANLMIGEFEHGWREYEFRSASGFVRHAGLPEATLWTGAPGIAGKTLLVHHEQGFGDTLQFVRFVGRLGALGARVVLRVQDSLLDLLRDVPGAAEVIASSAPLPAHDFHVPLLSLPFALGLREPDFSTDGPYLHASPQRVARWNDFFSGATRRPRVGIAWSGSPAHPNDRKRSMTLAVLEPLFDLPVDFVSLQKEVRPGDRELLERLVRQSVVRDASARLADFSDSAALIDQLDLVISVDTAIVHLAGALGKPVWVALQFTPDWRWQLSRRDSPWYAGAKLFRQSAEAGWPGVVAAIRQELADLCLSAGNVADGTG